MRAQSSNVLACLLNSKVNLNSWGINLSLIESTVCTDREISNEISNYEAQTVFCCCFFPPSQVGKQVSFSRCLPATSLTINPESRDVVIFVASPPQTGDVSARSNCYAETLKKPRKEKLVDHRYVLNHKLLQ